ncbi:UNVERIFIED_CONTAM: hypothetical protein NCL1_46230 [Trichonephila clavipes]
MLLLGITNVSIIHKCLQNSMTKEVISHQMIDCWCSMFREGRETMEDEGRVIKFGGLGCIFSIGGLPRLFFFSGSASSKSFSFFLFLPEDDPVLFRFGFTGCSISSTFPSSIAFNHCFSVTAARMRSSTEFTVTNLNTLTSFCCPILFKPRPPARVLNKNKKYGESGSLKSCKSCPLSSALVVPSSRSCIMEFMRVLAPPLPFLSFSDPSVNRTPFVCMCLYSTRCKADMSHFTTYSTFSGS